MRRISTITAMTALLISGSAAAVSAGAATPSRTDASLTRSDFNGDSFDDLAIGVPLREIGAANEAGAVVVLAGSASGVTGSGAKLWSQNSAGIMGQSQANEQWGTELATGDFNGDGFDDLVVPAPLDLAFNEIFGSASGLTASGNKLITANPTPFPAWGFAAGDFNGDGYEDLAWGDNSQKGGGVQIRYGSPIGLTDSGSQVWTQDSSGVCDVAEDNDAWGETLSTGNFNGDGFDDLAVSATQESLGAITATGQITILFGTLASGLTGTGSQCLNQNTPGILGTAASFDYWGWGTGAGDFNGDGYDDLGVADSVEGDNVIYGSAAGLTVSGNQLWVICCYGYPIVGGDFNGDGFDDMASGEPFNNSAAGDVRVLYGTAAGLSTNGQQTWDQDSPGIPDQKEAQDWFGISMSAGNYGNGPEDDLAVGVPLESFGTLQEVGAANLIYGSAFELTSTGAQLWSTPRRLSAAGDHFSYVINGAEVESK